MTHEITNVASETAVSPYPTSRLSSPFEPVDQAIVLAESDRYLGAVARGQLQLIVEQIASLQARARAIVEEVETNRRLHRATCTLQKRPGHVYHLYLRVQPDTQVEYFSMLSPEEWGTPPHPFLGSYKLNEDLSWTRVDSK